MSDFEETWILSTNVSKNHQISNFMSIRPVEAELFHADGWAAPPPPKTADIVIIVMLKDISILQGSRVQGSGVSFMWYIPVPCSVMVCLCVHCVLLSGSSHFAVSCVTLLLQCRPWQRSSLSKHVSLNIIVFYKAYNLTTVTLKLPTIFFYIVRSVHSITKEQHSNNKTHSVLP